MSAQTAESFVHPALFYRDEATFLAGTVPFIQDGLAAGEPVAVSVPGPNLDLLRAELGEQSAGVLMLDMTQVGRNPGRIIPGVLRAFADQHPDRHVRIIGEPIWAGRTDLEYPACAQHEALINLAFTGRDVTILCPYDIRRLHEEVLADALLTHPVVIDETGQRDSAAYDPQEVVARYNRQLPDPPPQAARLAFDGATLTQARRLAVTHGQRAGLSSDRLIDLELIAAELTTNSVEHGGGAGNLTVWVDDEHVVCQVQDAGHIGNPLAGRLPASPTQSGGRGLLLVNHLAELVRTHTDESGTTIRAHLRRKSA